MPQQGTPAYREAAGRPTTRVQWVVEIDLDECANTYTQAPCMAADKGDGLRCRYSWSTCQDPANFQKRTWTLRLCLDSQPWTDTTARALPYLRGVVDVPQEIKPSKLATFPESLSFQVARDFAPTPRDITRGDGFYNTAVVGEFWSNLFAVQRNWSGKPVRVFRGIYGLPFADFVRIGPVYNLEAVTINRDTFSIKAESPIVELDRVRVPVSIDEENTVQDVGGIGATDTTVDVADGSEYPDPANFSRFGVYVQIEDEVCELTGINGNQLTIVRGRLGTTAAAHAQGQKVSHVAFFGTDNGDGAPTGRNVVEVLLDLLEWAGIDPGDINTGSFRLVKNHAWPRSTIRRLLTRPQAVAKLMQPLRESRGIVIYMDAGGQWACNVMAPNDDPIDISDEVALVDSITVNDDSGERITRAELWFDPFDPDDAGNEPKDYRQAVKVIELELENENNFDGVRQRVLTDPWSASDSLTADIRTVAQRLVTRKRYGDRVIAFALNVGDAIYNVGDSVRLATRRLLGVDGAPDPRQGLITAKKQTGPARTEYRMVDVGFNGRYMRIGPDDMADEYVDGSELDRQHGYWADDNGRLRDTGEPAYIYF